MFFLGYDLGSSSIKASIVDESNHVLASTSYPETELPISSPLPGWAEQDPATWWNCVVAVTKKVLTKAKIAGNEITSIGIAYQMHGLVLLDKELKVLRPSIIWCDSRAVTTGNEILEDIGEEVSHSRLLNGPSNFTFSKLRWVQQHEPELFGKVRWIMLPGDYIAWKLTGKVTTTISGLSEGTMWDFNELKPAHFLFDHYGMNKEIIPDIVPTFGDQGTLAADAATQLGLSSKTQLSYRAGDQPNNALSLGVLQPGEIAATGGTSGVVYGVEDKNVCDTLSRVNSFAHVNYNKNQPYTGVLLCINGSGIQYSWAKKLTGSQSYDAMEKELSAIPIGSDGISVLPFGNGAERVLENKNIGGHLSGVNFNRHSPAHFYRASLEGIACAFRYGMDILKDLGIPITKLRVGNDNLFRSATFSHTMSNLNQVPIEVVKTTGSEGAARGAGFGCEHFSSLDEAVKSNPIVQVYTPDPNSNKETEALYVTWKNYLNKLIQS